MELRHLRYFVAVVEKQKFYQGGRKTVYYRLTTFKQTDTKSETGTGYSAF